MTANAEPKGLDVLAVAAHPDDVELSAGGTLLHLANKGYRTGILDLTRGEAATRGTPEMRASEAAEAAGILSVSVRENLGLPDSGVTCDAESRVQLVRAIRRLRPRIILTQHWDDPHPDHAQTSRLVREASHFAGLTKFDAEAGLERFRPSSIAYFLFSHRIAPSFLVDISGTYERKLEAIRAHRSQFFNPVSNEPGSRVSSERFLREMDSRDRYFGALINCQYAEGFFVREALNVDDPVELLTRPMNMYS